MIACGLNLASVVTFSALGFVVLMLLVFAVLVLCAWSALTEDET